MLEDGYYYAVLIENHDGYLVPISYGDSELEVRLWLKEHAKHFSDERVVIGYVVDLAADGFK